MYGEVRTIVDKETEVNYLSTVGNGYNDLTPLLDASGKVIIDQKEKDPFEF